ncbi:MAG: hypothetical protein AMQ22_00062 [Candidatus Methanofastidiosum methylothiophilum]|uniref:Uncharacterized protein n=1 Tax=Candidatus Methanofastidiosum methylothiophilum TaxID=1705564 RepID=A0A150J9B9_9EURY|nr:MAG: hypothetical protein AMQ22_00062 [Candidatus Methanofastidiosum methylthiophilus]
MVNEPVITVTKANDIDIVDDSASTTEFLPAPDDDIGIALKPILFGNVKAGEATIEQEYHIWNNIDGDEEGGVDLGIAYNLSVTASTLRGQNAGGTIKEGKEVVELREILVIDVSGGGTVYKAVGGLITLTLGDLRGDKLATPGIPTGTAGHESGGEVLPGTYYLCVSATDETGETEAGSESAGVTISPLDSQTDQDGESETLDNTTNTRIGWKKAGIGTFINGLQVLQSAGGTLEGTLRLETDNSGSPSGTLVNENAEKTGISFQDAIKTSILWNNEQSWTDGTTYWFVFVITAGTGKLKGKATGTNHNVKIYTNGSWQDSSTIYELYAILIGNNKIDWDWADVDYAQTYKAFRTETSQSYGAESLLIAGLNSSGYEDKKCDTVEGTPLEEGTVTRKHKKVIKAKVAADSTSHKENVEFNLEFRYNLT